MGYPRWSMHEEWNDGKKLVYACVNRDFIALVESRLEDLKERNRDMRHLAMQAKQALERGHSLVAEYMLTELIDGPTAKQPEEESEEVAI